VTPSPAQRLHLSVWRRALGAASVARNLAGIAEKRGIRIDEHAYGSHTLERLDRIAPTGPASRTSLVYIHGGGWVSGVRALYRPDLAPLARRGRVVWNLDYPLAPESPFPGPLVSVLRALAWIRAREPDLTAVDVAGDSAGGNLAMMCGVVISNPALLERLDGAPPRSALPAVRKVVSIYGVLDRFTWLEHRFPSSRLFMRCYGGEAAFDRQVRAENAFTPMDLSFDVLPPALLVGAGKDPLCPSTRLCHETFAARGLPVTLAIYPREPHGFLNMQWRAASRELKRDVHSFLEQESAERRAGTCAAGAVLDGIERDSLL
jgi:acetyl esterase/lipase